MREEIERRRAEAAEKKKQMEEESSESKPAFTVSPKGSSKVSCEVIGQMTTQYERLQCWY